MISMTIAAPRIAYEDQGRGEPALLFLPGWASDHSQVDPTARLSAKHRRVLVLDWRGHGRSERPSVDFGYDELVEDALAVIDASGAQQMVPVAQAHAGWVAVEFRRRLGERVPKLVLTSWLVLDPPPPFLAAIAAMQDPARWQEARDRIFATWLEGVTDSDVVRFVREVMGSYGFEMWARAGREITAAYAQYGTPLKALAELDPPVPTLHLYGQPPDPGYLAAQEAFAAQQPWFRVRRLEARSHFPTIEAPAEVSAAIEAFVASEHPQAPS
jgi:pimeloyl-ACP methyl ester carboxylesterase